jgi:hypothetical protein
MLFRLVCAQGLELFRVDEIFDLRVRLGAEYTTDPGESFGPSSRCWCSSCREGVARRQDANM